MKLRFAKPEKNTKKHEDIDECPGKELEWKLGYISYFFQIIKITPP